jgi:ADP-ribosylglycohydrolase
MAYLNTGDIFSVICNSISPDNLIYNVIKTGGDTDTIEMIVRSIYGAQKDCYVPEHI